MTGPNNNDIWVEVIGDRVNVPNWAALGPHRIDHTELTYRLEISNASPEAVAFIRDAVNKAIEHTANMTALAGHGTVTAYRSEKRSVEERPFFDNEPL